MTKDIPINVSLVGVGGQGILLTSDILARAAMHEGLDVKKSEIHGMAQRGGSVISQVRFGPRVHSPIIADGESDVLVAFERMEALRWNRLPKKNAQVIVNDINICPVTVSSGQQPAPDNMDEKLTAEYANLCLLPANDLAQQVGNLRTANLVIAGALSNFVPFAEESWLAAIRERLPEKMHDINIKAFQLGRAQAKK